MFEYLSSFSTFDYIVAVLFSPGTLQKISVGILTERSLGGYLVLWVDAAESSFPLQLVETNRLVVDKGLVALEVLQLNCHTE